MLHTTNYINTLIEPAEDSPHLRPVVPKPNQGKTTIATFQYDLLHRQAYHLTSDELLFRVHALRNGLDVQDIKALELFFSKPQACLRTSPLTKKFGWAIHADSQGRIALIDVASPAYQALQTDPKVKKVKAMRSKRR